MKFGGIVSAISAAIQAFLWWRKQREDNELEKVKKENIEVKAENVGEKKRRELEEKEEQFNKEWEDARKKKDREKRIRLLKRDFRFRNKRDD